MKIILTITNSKGNSILFVSDNLQTNSLKKAIELAKNKILEDIYVVHRKTGDYLRTNRKKGNSLDHLSISLNTFLSSINDINKILVLPSLKGYFDSYQNLLINQEQKGEDIIRIDGFLRSTKKHVKEKLLPYKQLIFDSSNKFAIDPYLLGAILIDEIARLSPFEDIIDKLIAEHLNYNSSVGIAQIMIETARILIRTGYYNPDPNNERLNRKNINKTPRSYLYQYIIGSKDNIYFSAAFVRYLIDRWKNEADVNLTQEIIATLYSLDRTPHANPQPNSRGLQIVNEFIILAKEILN